eukprot:1513689-Rhodomonas_salina.3
MSQAETMLSSATVLRASNISLPTETTLWVFCHGMHTPGFSSASLTVPSDTKISTDPTTW